MSCYLKKLKLEYVWKPKSSIYGILYTLGLLYCKNKTQRKAHFDPFFVIISLSYPMLTLFQQSETQESQFDKRLDSGKLEKPIWTNRCMNDDWLHSFNSKYRGHPKDLLLVFPLMVFIHFPWRYKSRFRWALVMKLIPHSHSYQFPWSLHPKSYQFPTPTATNFQHPSLKLFWPCGGHHQKSIWVVLRSTGKKNPQISVLPHSYSLLRLHSYSLPP